MPRTITGGAPKHYRSTAAMTRGALSGDSIVRTERWWPPDRGDPPSRGMVGWEIGASTCGPDTRASSRSSHKVSSNPGVVLTGLHRALS
ncbi:hypothetical protein GCM10010276_76660 [Streptomyces longisporus]|uniref:Uncharacterized protein n=1 Tax=Streptomyces longisporus TaxID=1948 RepID=A0ABN3NC12_STRLO